MTFCRFRRETGISRTSVPDRLHLRCRRRLNERRRLGDGDRFRQAANLERVCLPQPLAGAERQPPAVVGLESCEFDLDRIGPLSVEGRVL